MSFRLLGRRRRSWERCRNDIRALCARGDRMDLWQLYRELEGKTYIINHARCAHIAGQGLDRLECYLRAIERHAAAT